MKMCKIYRAVFPLILLSLLNGCFSGSGALIQEKDAELERLRSELVELEKRLDNEIIALKEQSSKRKSLDEALKVEQKNNQNYMAEIEQLKGSQESQFVIGNRIILTNAVVFKGGSAELSEKGKQYLDEIMEALGKYPNREIIVEGHCDNIPIAASYRWKYPSNWELSSARSINVLHYFEQNKSLDPQLLGAIAYGEHRPIASNKTASGRAQNRRVEIVIGQSVK